MRAPAAFDATYALSYGFAQVYKACQAVTGTGVCSSQRRRVVLHLAVVLALSAG
jgi:hypothetical protein